MTTLTRSGDAASVPQEAIEALRTTMSGGVLMAEDADYADARQIWNGMVDRKPGMILRCATPGDVKAAVRFASEHDLLVTVRGGGHNIAGNAVADGAIMIDLSPMRAVEVDASAKRARVEAGALLSDVDAATQAHGLALPLGINSTTGIAGLTLGGGFGWLSRKHGMTIDNLISAEVVTADGRSVRASEDENPNLFWGLRGGGGNFGIVTSFEFQLHEVGPEVLAGLIVHPFEDAERVLRAYRAFAEAAPDDLTVWVVLRKAPPLPFLPEEWHGREVLVLAAFHAGDVEHGKKLLEPLRSVGEPIADVIGPQRYTDWQQAFDPLLTPGARNYWKSHDFAQLSDDLLDTVLEQGGRLPTSECEVFIAQMGGAASRVPADATAYPHRDVNFIMNVHTRWRGPELDGDCIEWTRGLFKATAPHATGGVYVNFMPDDEVDRVAAAYGDNHARLVELKREWDPANRFRMNQNIRPGLRK
jgi:FAD/FMN-containing dehydrogenase